MNYLAHAFLSFNKPDILIGNMISDFVKGKKQFQYPEPIQKGIRLHRIIDSFTDSNPATQAAKVLLKPAVGAYAGAFMDVVYDHFLATDSGIYTADDWHIFSQHTYQILQAHKTILPDRFAQLLPYMSSQNWLYNYRYKWGIEKSFEGVVRRAAYLNESTQVFELFERNYLQFQQAYHEFFPHVKKLAEDFVKDI